MDRVTSKPEIMSGKPIIKGTRITVEYILDLLASGMTPKEICLEHPQLTLEDIRAAIEYANKLLKDTEVYPAKVATL